MADDSPPHDDLEALARRRFGNLSEAERRLVQAAPKGVWAACGGPSSYNDDPSKADHWGREREVRAELIRWLCVDEKAKKMVDPRGVRVRAAKISGLLDLSYATVLFPLLLHRCGLAKGGILRSITIPALDLNGSSTGPLDLINADVKNDVFFGEGFSAAGKVSLLGARIGGGLECSGGRFSNPDDDALSADDAEVKGNLFLDEGFSAVGNVSLLGARVGGDLQCSNGTFSSPGADALSAGRAEIRGNVYLDKQFSADGAVQLVGSQIGGNLNCSGGSFGSLFLRRATVRRTFFWQGVGNTVNLSLDLVDASVGAISDDRPSWPDGGRLHLDGFVYEHFAGGPTDAPARLDWLARQSEFTPQPYRQLAKVLREMGDDEGEKQILHELAVRLLAEERSRIAHRPMHWLRFVQDGLSDLTVGYGIYPARAVWYTCGLAALGWIVHRRAARVGAMAPTEKDAYEEFSKGETPKRYQPFNPLIYSVENCIPLVKLGQDDRWQPDPHPTRHAPPIAAGRVLRFLNRVLDLVVPGWAVSPVALRWFRWIMIGLGWLLATFFVAGLTGIIKTD